MLRQRVLTALVLAASLVAALFYLSTPWLAALFGGAIAVGAWEWAALIGFARRGARLAYVSGLILVGGAVAAAALKAPQLIAPLLGVAVLWWLWALVELARGGGVHKTMFTTLPWKAVAGFMVLIPAWLTPLYLYTADPRRPAAVLFVMFLVWTADTAAYFAGHAFGKTKLAPDVSPGKTVEGLLGGLAAAVLFAYLCGVIVWNLDPAPLALWIALAAVVTLFAALGDLVESKLKRLAGVKDSGRLLPGHGGILDRIDAFTAAAPVFALGWLLWFGPR